MPSSLILFHIDLLPFSASRVSSCAQYLASVRVLLIMCSVVCRVWSRQVATGLVRQISPCSGAVPHWLADPTGRPSPVISQTRKGLADWLTGWPDWLTDWLDWLTDWLTDWPDDWLTWLAGWLAGLLVAHLETYLSCLDYDYGFEQLDLSVRMPSLRPLHR